MKRITKKKKQKLYEDILIDMDRRQKHIHDYYSGKIDLYEAMERMINNNATMKKILLIFIIISSAIISGCKEEAQSSEKNGNFTVEFLFEQNGCKMYRFRDGGRYVYWSDCQDKTQSDYNQPRGKGGSVTYNEETITTK
jgi:hypothetical protein